MNVLVIVGVRILEFLFFAGWIGSLLVIILSGIEDLEVIFSEDSHEPPRFVTQGPGTPS